MKKINTISRVTILSLVLCSCITEIREPVPPICPSSPPVFEYSIAFPGMKSELIKLKSGISLEKKGNYYIWQGDIVLSETQYKALEETGTLFSESTPDAYKLWKGEIPFSFHPDILKETETGQLIGMKDWILASIKNWEAHTNLRFRNVTEKVVKDPGSVSDYIEFVRSDGDWSYLGRIGGKQLLGTNRRSTCIMRSIGHALGMLNVLNRYDRDKYLTVYYNRIENINVIYDDDIRIKLQPLFEKNIKIYTIEGAFDDKSIMLSPSYLYSAVKKGKILFTKKDGITIFNTSLSEGDIAWVNKFYPL